MNSDVREGRLILTGVLVVLVVGFVTSVFVGELRARARDTEELPIGSWACLADTEICPDGTAVGRVPPYCMFANCPR